MLLPLRRLLQDIAPPIDDHTAELFPYDVFSVKESPTKKRNV